MQCITDKTIADQIYQLIASKVYFDRDFSEGVLKEYVSNKIWIDFWSFHEKPLFGILKNLTDLSGQKEYIIALHPKAVDSFRAASGAYPIIRVDRQTTLHEIFQPPKGSHETSGLVVGRKRFYIFNESLDWLLYCDLDYELRMLCCFNQALYPAVEREVKAALMATFNDDELITTTDFFDPDYYSALSAAQIAALVALYDNKPES